MGKFRVNITETYIYKIDIDAETKAEAIRKSKEIYETVLDDDHNEYRFCADANSHVKTTFAVKGKVE